MTSVWSTWTIFSSSLVFSKTFDEHLERLATVFNRFDRYGLKLKPSKCSLFQRKVCFLGHVVSGHGIQCDPDKVASIATWPTPSNMAEVRTFCGLASYYRTFVCNFAAIARPLHNLTKRGAVFEWTPECEHAFQQLKQALTSAPILVAPCDEGQYVLDTDASDTALGAVLQQEQGGKLHVIGYASRTLTPAEARYCITRRELLGVVFGLKKYRQHLLGRSIIVRTDHAALAYLMKTPEPISQQGRWLDLLGSMTSPFNVDQGKFTGIATPCHDVPANGTLRPTVSSVRRRLRQLPQYQSHARLCRQTAPQCCRLCFIFVHVTHKWRGRKTRSLARVN